MLRVEHNRCRLAVDLAISPPFNILAKTPPLMPSTVSTHISVDQTATFRARIAGKETTPTPSSALVALHIATAITTSLSTNLTERTVQKTGWNSAATVCGTTVKTHVTAPRMSQNLTRCRHAPLQNLTSRALLLQQHNLHAILALAHRSSTHQHGQTEKLFVSR